MKLDNGFNEVSYVQIDLDVNYNSWSFPSQPLITRGKRPKSRQLLDGRPVGAEWSFYPNHVRCRTRLRRRWWQCWWRWESRPAAAVLARVR